MMWRSTDQLEVTVADINNPTHTIMASIRYLTAGLAKQVSQQDKPFIH
jgi:hypothetical protein